MKVAFLIDTISTDTAGTQKQLLEMIRRLDRSTFEPQLICLWESPWMKKNSLPCTCTVLGYRGFLKTNFPGVVRRLARIISEQRIDIVHTFFEDSIFVAWFSAAFARPRPVLLSSRRDIGLGRKNQPWYHSLFRLALPYVNRSFAGIVANSEEVRRYVAQRERTPLSKIKVHYNGVAFPTHDPAPAIPATIAAHPNATWIAICASLTPVKRHDLLFNAFARLPIDGASTPPRLILLGEGPERSTLESLASDLGIRDRVHFEGAVKDINTYLRHVDIGVLCSDREGLSNAILEYMVYSLPVVATRVGGNVELVDHDNGRLVPPDDVDALAAALRELIDDEPLRHRLGAASRRKVSERFSWERSMRTIEDYYRSLAPSN